MPFQLQLGVSAGVSEAGGWGYFPSLWRTAVTDKTPDRLHADTPSRSSLALLMSLAVPQLSPPHLAHAVV